MSAQGPLWFKAINELLDRPENKAKTVYQVATVDPQTGAPRVRSQGHRRFLTPKGVPNLPVLLTTTDVRALKVEHILANPAVDVALWLERAACQFRFTGRAAIVPAPEHPLYAKCMSQLHHADNTALALLEAHGKDGSKAYWEAQRREAFRESRPQLKASWSVPLQPGSVLASYDVLAKYPTRIPNWEETQDEEEKQHWRDALANYALMLIEPTQVEWLQLDVDPNQRSLYTKGKSAPYEWKEEVLVP